MDERKKAELARLKDVENREWLESLDQIYQEQGPERVRELLWHLHVRTQKYGVRPHFTANTPYINTIPVEQQPPSNRMAPRSLA